MRMKTTASILLFTGIFALSVALHAQDPAPVSSCTYEAIGGETFESDEAALGKVDLQKIQQREGVVMTASGRVRLTFKDKKLLEEVYYNSGAADKKETLRKLNSYNGDNLLSRTIETFDGGAWKENQRYTYTYEGADITSCTCQTKKGGDWENSMQYSFTYDAKRNVVSRIQKHWNGSAWENVGLYNYAYDAKAMRTEETYQRWNAAKWENVYKFAFSYNEIGKISSRTRQTWEEGEWEFSARDIYTYDESDDVRVITQQN